MLSSWWNVLLNRSGSEMVEDVVKVLDHIMKWERVNVYSAYSGDIFFRELKIFRKGKKHFPL